MFLLTDSNQRVLRTLWFFAASPQESFLWQEKACVGGDPQRPPFCLRRGFHPGPPGAIPGGPSGGPSGRP